MFESLETRRLMAAPTTGSPLTIIGTEAADTILLSQSGNMVYVTRNGVTSSYAMSYSIGPSPTSGPFVVIPRVVVHAYGGSDTVWADPTVTKPVDIYGGAGNDSIRGGSSNDRLYGGTGGSSTSYESGFDTINGNAGNDLIMASRFQRCTLWGGANNDSLSGGSQIDYMYGGDGNDFIDGMDAGDVLYGDAGYDTIFGGVGDDYLFGQSENDSLDGGWGQDTFYGSTGNDTLLGGQGSDYMRGDAGNDSLDGGADNDLLYGGADNDWMTGGIGNDQFIGESGLDTVCYSDRSVPVVIKQDGLANDGEDADLNGSGEEADNVGSDVETIFGGSGNDLIQGASTNNRIDGGNGNDTIRGGLGHDTILGGWGHDVLHGEADNDWIAGYYENDQLYGGAGIDTLVGEEGDDTMVAIGGGNQDQLWGQGGLDSFWMDNDSTETHDAISAESNSRRVHRIQSFSNGASKELNGQNLPDPGLDNPSTEVWTTTNETDTNPLFSSYGPTSDDIDQGGLGTCWFLATLSAIAWKDPNVIRQSVVELGDGTFAAMFYDYGIPRYYRVDNDLPVQLDMNLNPTTALAYADPGVEGAMWVPIMEKAYALHGGFSGGDGDYGGIVGGYSRNAFGDLGVTSEEVDVDDSGVLQQIANTLASGNAVTIQTIDGEFTSGDPIVYRHQYAVMSVDVNAGTITLRNPWATDAGSKAGAWVQGANDGYVTFTWNQWFRDQTEAFTIGDL